jgi:transcriptional regulator with XRE-family HTH domain
MEEPHPSDLFRFLLEAREITEVELADQTEIARDRISAIVAGEQEPSIQEARKLAAYFRVDPSLFRTNKTV